MVDMSTWNPQTWRNREAKQQPSWPDEAALDQVLKTLSTLPPLVFAGEARTLTDQLGQVCNGEAFLLQAGDCAESFDASTDSIRDRLRVILQMAVVLSYSTGLPTVKIGRIAGQFAKPRSADTETVDGVELPSFRGHMVNDENFAEDARRVDPERLIQAYSKSASTLNLLRAFCTGGYANLNRVQDWNQEFVADSPAGEKYAELADGITAALDFMRACGIDPEDHAQLDQVDFYTSHEALVLGYEEALTRQDSLTDDWYDCSAHMLWIGERTRDLDGAHVEFLRGVANPVGCKLGPTASPEDAIALCEALNPDRIPGKLTLITRFGADKVAELLPPILEAVRDSGHPVVWECDPMHGNTYTSENGRKTRHFDNVLGEILGYFDAHAAAGTWPGGIHIELTGDDVTECLGGSQELADDDLELRYETVCDPRLNGRQSLDLAFMVADRLKSITSTGARA